MSIRILEVTNRSDLKRWVKFPLSLFAGNEFYVPPLVGDEIAYFEKRKNPAFQVCEARLFVALDGDRVIGRICGIINSLEEEKLGYKRGRFGWFDSIDSQDVANGLFDCVKSWLVNEQCAEMTGPHGFNDLDGEGLLIEGFDELPTIAGNYAYPYYKDLVEKYGFEKEVDYVEKRCRLPRQVPVFERMRKRYATNTEYRVVTCTSKKELLTHVKAMWELLETAFEPLYGVVPLTNDQTKFYTKKYFGFLDPEFVKFTYANDGQMVAFMVAIPNLSAAFRKAGGKLFPTGFVHILKAFRKPETMDSLLGAIRPGRSAAAIRSMTWIDMYDTMIRRNIEFVESNHQLEDNTKADLFARYEVVYERRARVFRLALPRSTAHNSAATVSRDQESPQVR
jgi:hypothetical protein